MKSHRAFINRAKSGASAMSARWRQQAEKGRVDKARKRRASESRVSRPGRRS
jgi:hypothetical protein